MRRLMLVLLCFCSVATAQWWDVVPNQQPPLGMMVVPGAPYGHDLCGMWTFADGGASLIGDISGGGHHGRVVAAPYWRVKSDGYAVLFTAASSQYIDCGPVAVPGAFTLIAWVDWPVIDSLAAAARAVSFYDTQSGKRGGFEFSSSDENDIFLTYDQTHYASWEDTALNGSTYVMLAAVHDGSTGLSLYIDGVDQGTADATGDPSDDAVNALYIGAAVRSPAERFYNNYVYRVLLYRRALSSWEILQLYSDPFIMLRPSISVETIQSGLPEAGATGAFYHYLQNQ